MEKKRLNPYFAALLAQKWQVEMKRDPEIVGSFFDQAKTSGEKVEGGDTGMDKMCGTGENEEGSCGEMKHCSYKKNSFLSDKGTCSLNVDSILYLFKYVAQKRDARIRAPVRAILLHLSENPVLQNLATKMIFMYERKAISYGDILASIYLAAPLLWNSTAIEHIDSIAEMWLQFSSMHVPFALKVDMADNFYMRIDEAKSGKAPSRIQNSIARDLMGALLVAGAAVGAGFVGRAAKDLQTDIDNGIQTYASPSPIRRALSPGPTISACMRLRR